MLRTLPHHHPPTSTMLMNNVTVYQVFDAALFIFGCMWSTLMAIGIIAAICAMYAFCKAYAQYNGSSDWADHES